MDNIHSANGNVEPGDKHLSSAAVEAEVQNLNSSSRRLSPPSVAMETSKEPTEKPETATSASPSAPASQSPAPDRPEDQNNNNQRGCSPAHSSVGHATPSPSPPAPPSQPKVGVRAELFSLRAPHMKAIVSSLRLWFCAAGEADQPEEASVRADGPRPESQVQPSGSAAGRIAGGRV